MIAKIAIIGKQDREAEIAIAKIAMIAKVAIIGKAVHPGYLLFRAIAGEDGLRIEFVTFVRELHT